MSETHSYTPVTIGLGINGSRRRSGRGQQWLALFCLMFGLNGVRADTNISASAADTPDGKPVDWRIDRMNEAVFRILERPVDAFDGWFASKEEKGENERLRNSTFRVRLNFEMRADGGLEFSFKPDYTVDLYLPHLNRRLHLLVRSTDIDDLSDKAPDEEEKGTLVGLGASRTNKYWGDFSLGVGMKVQIPPEPYVGAGWRRPMHAGNLIITPQQRVFWQGDDGFGELTKLQLAHPIRQRTLSVATSGAKWGEHTSGVEWSQSALLGWYWRGYQRRELNRHPMLGLKGVVQGHTGGQLATDVYRIESVLRYPLRKKWMFVDFIPFVEWTRSNHWNTTPGVWVALDFFFDGSAVTRASEMKGEDYPALEFDPAALDEQ